MTTEKTTYAHYGACVALSNNEVEVLVTTDLGPRVIAYRFVGGPNMLAEMTADAVEKTTLGDWHPWGGHRLWHAPEDKPRSYSPDDDPLDVETAGENSVTVTQPVEPATHIQKQMIVTLDPRGTRVTLTHRLTNKGLFAVELAPWALTIMRGGGVTIFPQEPFTPHGESLLPARPMVLWSYTDLSDPRWTVGKKYVRLRTDEKLDYAQKLGAANKQEWAAYLLENTLFVKRFPYIEGACYPDYGCNFETFTKGTFMEVETLGPLVTLEPGQAVEHIEQWFLFANVDIGDSEDSLDAAITPLVRK